MGDWNYSQLVQTFWKTCADNGIGALLRPGQKRRDAHADADVKRISAQGDYDADLIRRGEKHLADFQRAGNRRLALQEDRREPELDLESLPLIVADQQSADALRKEINVAKALVHAEGDLARDSSPAPERVVDGDWLRRWRYYAGEVSSEDLQSIWGRLLAGEVKDPGIHSLRTLDLLRNLSTEDANLIAKLAPFVLHGFVFRLNDINENRAMEVAGLSFGELLYLEEIGILNGVMSGLNRTWNNVAGTDSFEILFNTKDVGLLLTHHDVSVRCDMPGIGVTKPGIQILQLCDFTENKEYLIELGFFYKKQGFKAELCEIEHLPDGRAAIIANVVI